jgi:hypothetical protein
MIRRAYCATSHRRGAWITSRLDKVQGNLRADVLNEYIRHTSSCDLRLPPGVDGPEDYCGRALFE